MGCLEVDPLTKVEFDMGDLAASPGTFGPPSSMPSSVGRVFTLPTPCLSLIVSTRGHRGSPGKNKAVLCNLTNPLSRGLTQAHSGL